MGAFTVKDNITSFDHEQITIVNTQVTVSHVSPLKIIIGTNTLVPSHSVPDYLYTYIGVAVLSCLTLVSTLLWLPPGPVFVAARGQFREEITLGEEGK